MSVSLPPVRHWLLGLTLFTLCCVLAVIILHIPSVMLTLLIGPIFFAALNYSRVVARLSHLIVIGLALLGLPFYAIDLPRELVNTLAYGLASALLTSLISSLSTDRTRVQNALSESETRLRMIVENLSEALLITDLDDVVLYANGRVEELTGYKPEELVGKPAYTLLLPPEQWPVMHGNNARRAQGTAERYQIELMRKDGSRLWTENFASPLRNATGQIVGTVGTLVDIAERKRAEAEMARAHAQALQASRLKSEFLAMTSHEMRTPMNGIIGMTELLLDTPLDAEQTEFATTVMHEARSLLGIINTLLDMSRLEAGTVRLETGDFDLVTVVERVGEDMAAIAGQKKLTLMTYIDPALPLLMVGDQGRLGQVLRRLIDNAIKFTESGEIVIRALLHSQNSTHITVMFRVTDTGIGIASTDHELIFQPFMQVDSSSTRRYGGTGLGLTIAKRLVLLMDGEIGVESAVGSGSTFWFTIPFGRSKLNASLPDTLTTAMLKPRALALLQKARILYVGSNSAQADILELYLTHWSVNTLARTNPAEALSTLSCASAQGNSYHVVLLDTTGNDASGEAMKALSQAIESDTALAMTQTLPIVPYESLTYRSLECLTMPISRAHLFSVLTRLLERPVAHSSVTTAGGGTSVSAQPVPPQ